MCSGIAFFFGLFLLFRGQLVINNRIIPPNKTRLIAFILMSPLLVSLFMGFFVFRGNGLEDMSSLYDAVLIELIVLVLALIGVGYIVSTTPPASTLPMQQMSPFAPPSVTPHVPDILTVPEAAAYLHVSEAEVMRLIDEGKLPAARIGDHFRIARIAIEDFLKQEQ